MRTLPASCIKEFHEALVRVARSRDDGVTLTQILKDYGVHEITLRKWISQAGIDDGNRPGRSREESTELRVLRRNRLPESTAGIDCRSRRTGPCVELSPT